MPEILIVDDSPTARQQLRIILQGDDYNVTEAVDGEEGLSKAKLGDFDLIIADLNMPKLNGIQMIEELRKVPAIKETPIFLLTTEGSPEMAQKGKTAGANAWIVKPFNSSILLSAVQHACTGPHSASGHRS